MRLSTAPLLLTALLSAAAQTPAPATSPAAATATYRNDALHLTYTYPASYTDASALVGPAMQASLGDDPTSADAARCVSLPFSRMATGPKPDPARAPQTGTGASAGPGQISIVAIVHADASCLKKKFNPKNLAEFTEGEAQGLTAAGAKTTFGHPLAYTVANRPAALLQGTFSIPAGQVMHALVTCILDQPDIICWQFLTTSADTLRTLTTFPVTFDNTPTTALVPTALLKP